MGSYYDKPGDQKQKNTNKNVNIINVNYCDHKKDKHEEKYCDHENNETAYPPVSILNSTPFSAFGDVNYASFLCSDDHYNVDSTRTWTADSRGVCLVTRITAIVRTPNGDIAATPYTSSGTSYSQFAIIQTGPNQFEVTRRVSE